MSRIDTVVISLGVAALAVVFCGALMQSKPQSNSDLHVSPSQTQPEKTPAPARSLEKIDQWNWHTFGGSGVYLFRVTTCYYVVAFGDNSVAVTHLASCPSPNHRQWSGFLTGEPVRPGDPVIGRPLGDTDFSGVILEDEVKRRKGK